MAKQDYLELRDETWPFGDIWGDDAEYVVDYLRTVYMENNEYRFVKKTKGKVRREAEIILAWWWERYGRDDSREIDEYPRNFGRWLLRQYNESLRMNPIDNVGYGPRN